MTNEPNAPLSKAQVTAGAVLADLSDRCGIGNELERCDEDIKREIRETLARIIEEGMK